MRLWVGDRARPVALVVLNPGRAAGAAEVGEAPEEEAAAGVVPPQEAEEVVVAPQGAAAVVAGAAFHSAGQWG